MTLVIGIDEAGYGPNLGPLVIGGSVWEVDETPTPSTAPSAVDPGARFADLTTAIAADWRDGCGPPWGDSKKVFSRKAGGSALEPLERGVLAAVLSMEAALPATAGSLLDVLGLSLPTDASQACWQDLAAVPLPQATQAETSQQQADTVRQRCRQHQLRLVGLACRWVWPAAFNAQLDAGLNKSDVLSHVSLGLAQDLRQRQPSRPATIWCDRHGGRKRYAGVISHCFAAARVEPLSETANCSRYRLHDQQAATTIRFTVSGEADLPVAVASMTAKYIRELAMGAFNQFWAAQPPGVQPTAGYPVDARRWWQETARQRQQLGIADAALWRRA